MSKKKLNDSTKDKKIIELDISDKPKLSKDLQKKFDRIQNDKPIQNKEYVDADIGTLLEDQFGIKANPYKKPDIDGIELKSTRKDSTSNITLFSKNPLPRLTNSKIRLKYGYPDPENEFPSTIVLSSPPITPNKFSKCKQNEFGFKLVIDEKDEKIELLVKNWKTGTVIKESFEYKFDFIKTHIDEKFLNGIMYLWLADRRKDKKNESLDFSDYKMHHDMTFSKFLEYLKDEKIVFEFRIDVDRNPQKIRGVNKGKSNPRYGKHHDHGNGFRLKRKIALK